MFGRVPRQLELGLQSAPADTVRSREQAPTSETQPLHERRIGAFLTVMMGDAVAVRLTDNRRTLVSVRAKQGTRHVRLHRMFRHADDVLLRALGLYLMGIATPAVQAKIAAFIAAHRGEIRTAATRKIRRPLLAAGQHFDLNEVLRDVSQQYFGAALPVHIGWGQLRRRTARRPAKRISRALATYNFEDATIRVNPILDSPKVPRLVMEWIVYHELLHHVLPVQRSQGRSRYHTPEFRAMERAFVGYAEAQAWEQANVDWLVR